MGDNSVLTTDPNNYTREPTTHDIYVKEKSNTLSDPFWYEDGTVLFNRDRIIEFFPTKDMNLNERMNALSRFFIYLSIILFIVFHNYNLFFIPIIALSIIFFVWYNDAMLHKINIEQFDLKIKQDLGIRPDVPLKIDDVGNICQRPTPYNPFMNVLISDYTDGPNRPPACSQSDEDIKEETEKYFNYNLYKDVEDVWDKRNSQRQYVTMPWTTIPNDRDTFQKWLFKGAHSCRDGEQDFCLEYEDLRVPGYS
jgi:hypothetical protein